MRSVTVCTLDCPDACSLVLESRRGGDLRLTANPDSPFTRGVMCAKTRRHLRRLESAARLQAPMLRRGDRRLTISWESALDLCAEKFQACRGEPASILHLPSDGAKGVLKEAVGLFFAQLGAARVTGSLCDAAGFMAGVEDFGSRENHDIDDLARAAAVVIWGKDAPRSSVHTAAAFHAARRNGARVVTISPGAEGGSRPGEHIRIRPGTDRLLAAAVIRRLLDEGRIADVLEHTRRPERFLALVRQVSVAELLAGCEVACADLERLVELYRDASPLATFIGAGLQRYRYGGENVRFINALALLSGNVGVPGGGAYFHLHSYRNLDLSWTEGPGRRGRRTVRIAGLAEDLAAADPPVRLLWVNGANPVNQAPGAHASAPAFEKIEFTVVVDAFMTDTAARADLILPCTLMLEQEDVVGSYLHEYVQHAAAVAAPPALARDDLWIVTEVGRRLDPPVAMPAPEECLRAALRSPWLRTDLETLKRAHFVRSTRPAVAYEGLRFAHSDGRYRFPQRLHPEPPAPYDYPLRLLSLVRRGAIHSQILPQGGPATPPPVWVAPDCPALARLEPGRPAALVSPEGRLRVTVRTLPGLHPGAVVYRRGDWLSRGGGVNQLIRPAATDLGGGAAFYDQYVRLETDQEDAP
jgi:anaerobic selenocysteine-containing dehydrogenase